MTKSLLGQGNQKRAYSIGTDRGDRPPTFEQDSPKENFIVCPDCEAYFSILETYCNERLHRKLWDIRKSSDFKTETNVGGLTWKICLNADPIIIHLFIYSIVWRCSISNTPLFKNFKIDEEHEEGIRKSLLQFKYVKQIDLLTNLQQKEELFPCKFVFMTCDKFIDPTSNMLLHMTGNKNPYSLVLNEYMLFISFSKSDKQDAFQELNNSIPTNDKMKIGFLNEETWESHRSSIRQFVVKRTIENLEKDGKKPFLMDESKLK